MVVTWKFKDLDANSILQETFPRCPPSNFDETDTCLHGRKI